MDATYKGTCYPDRSDQQYPLTSARSAPWSGTADPSTPFHSGRDDKGEGCYQACVRGQDGWAPDGLHRDSWYPTLRLTPDFLSIMVTLTNFMRLSLQKAAHVAPNGAAW
jgi:hypothetical protein